MFLDAVEIGARVREIGAEIARDYADREPLLVGSLKACIPFICDLSRAIQIHHSLDFIELAGYGENDEGIRFLKDLNTEIEGRDVLLVDAVIDTGLTMHYLVALAGDPQSRVATHRDAVRPPLPAARRRPAGALRRFHDSRTSSSSATASSSTSATGTCPIFASCADF